MHAFPIEDDTPRSTGMVHNSPLAFGGEDDDIGAAEGGECQREEMVCVDEGDAFRVEAAPDARRFARHIAYHDLQILQRAVVLLGQVDQGEYDGAGTAQ